MNKFPEIKRNLRPISFSFTVTDNFTPAVKKMEKKLYDLNTEDIDYIDVTGEVVEPAVLLIEEHVMVNGKNYSLAGMEPVNGYPGSMSVCYKPDLTIE